jgi:glucose/mannose-6-phosphate isomerase
MRTLNAPERLRRVDRSNMLGVLDGYVDAFLSSFRRASHARLAAPAGLANVVVAGMGGSGIGGNLLAGLIQAECPVPISVLKDYTVPGAVGPKTLVLAVSYSGNTEETLAVAKEGVARGATLVGIASGGQLQRLARERGRHLPVPEGFQPRAALPQLFGTLLGAAHALRLTALAPDARLEDELRSFHATVAPTAGDRANPAKKTARALKDRFPVYYGAGLLAPVALRGRCQLNENAKMLARNDELPEANHNELVAWAAVPDPRRYFMSLLRQRDEPPEVGRRFDFVMRTLERRRVPHGTFTAEATSELGRVLQGLLFVDYVSVYAALLRGVDPTPVEVITDLKQALARPARRVASRRS